MSRPQALFGSLLFLIMAPGSVAGLLPWWLTQWRVQLPFLGIPLIPWIGAIFLSCGIVVLLECFFRFAWSGRGTPAPVAPTQSLMVSGLYRFVRNPMYVAVLLLIAGQALWLGSSALLLYGAGVWLMFHSVVVFYEEPTLRHRYDESYAAYCDAVPRWLPRLAPWRGDGAIAQPPLR